ncbi:hypothetical protein PI125_g16341 [Phytophthora idaei]|nr:hypothetical protein PI125_g16341 [Phytophthora idaei]
MAGDTKSLRELSARAGYPNPRIHPQDSVDVSNRSHGMRGVAAGYMDLVQ